MYKLPASFSKLLSLRAVSSQRLGPKYCLSRHLEKLSRSRSGPPEVLLDGASLSESRLLLLPPRLFKKLCLSKVKHCQNVSQNKTKNYAHKKLK